MRKKSLPENRCKCLLSGRDYVLPDDIRHMALPVLSHRVLLSAEARMRNMTSEKVLMSVLHSVQVPVRLS